MTLYPATEAESEIGAGDLGNTGATEVLVDWATATAALVDCRAVYTNALPPSPILRTMAKSERLPIVIFLPFFRFEMSPILPLIVNGLDGWRNVGCGNAGGSCECKMRAERAEVLEK